MEATVYPVPTYNTVYTLPGLKESSQHQPAMPVARGTCRALAPLRRGKAPLFPVWYREQMGFREVN